MHREQTGYVYKRHGWWLVRYYQTIRQGDQLITKQPSAKLAPVGPHYRTKASVKNLAAEKLKEINELNKNPEKVITIGDFVEQVYLPYVEQHKRPSTQKCYRDIWQDHCRLRMAGVLLRGVKTSHVQTWLEEIVREDKTKSGEQLSHQSMKNIKSVMSAIFKHAKRQGYFEGLNPVIDTAIPPTRKAGVTYAYSLEEITAILAVLPELAATVFAVAAFMGLRRGEIRGLLWQHYQNGEILISQSIWNGFATEPKTAKSAAPVPVIRQLRERLDMHRMAQGNPASGPIFRNLLGGPLDLNNLLGRVILPALNRCAVCAQSQPEHIKAAVDHDYRRDESIPRWRGWHAARRALGSNLYRMGVPELVIQRILRHSNVSTTTGYYIKTSSDDVRKAMTEFEGQIPALCAEHARKNDSSVNSERIN